MTQSAPHGREEQNGKQYRGQCIGGISQIQDEVLNKGDFHEQKSQTDQAKIQERADDGCLVARPGFINWSADPKRQQDN